MPDHSATVSSSGSPNNECLDSFINRDVQTSSRGKFGFMSFASYSGAQWVGAAFVFLGVVLGLAWLARRLIPGLAALFIPASVIAGFVILLIGPQMLGAWTGTGGLIPGEVIAVWSVLPGILINIVFAAVMLGRQLPSVKEIWEDSAPHFIFGSVLSFGQFALGAFAVVLILTPFFGLTDLAGSVLELSFAGGHGTIAGMGPLLEKAGASEVVDLGLGLATVSMVAGVIGGSILVRYAIRNPKIPVARNGPPSRTEALQINARQGIGQQETKPDADIGMSSVTAAFMFIALAIAVAIVILELLRFVFGSFGVDIFENFPLFPFTVIGGFLIQLIATRMRNVATGFILADMADPEGQTNVVTAYGYKQLTYEPILGGGLITAFSIPVIMEFGSLAFGIVSALVTVALVVWGVLRTRRQQPAG